MKCNHPKTKVRSVSASYENDDCVFVVAWRYECSRCKVQGRLCTGLRPFDHNYFEYNLFTGRNFEEDFAKQLKRVAIREARRQITEATTILKKLGAKR